MLFWAVGAAIVIFVVLVAHDVDRKEGRGPRAARSVLFGGRRSRRRWWR